MLLATEHSAHNRARNAETERRERDLVAQNEREERAPGPRRPKPGQRTHFIRKIRAERTYGTTDPFDLPPHARTLRDAAREKQERSAAGKQCTKLPLDGGPVEYRICMSRGSANINAFDINTKRHIGEVRASDKGEGLYKVGWSNTEEPQYMYLLNPDRAVPGGLGTRLYERALRAVCDVGKAKALTSDTTRSEFSEAFWRKQMEKGRATCEGNGSGSSYFGSPLFDAQRAFKDAEGMHNGPLWKKFTKNLPQYSKDDEYGAEDGGGGEYWDMNAGKYKYEKYDGGGGGPWPCDYYKMKCAGRPDRLDGLRGLKGSVPEHAKEVHALLAHARSLLKQGTCDSVVGALTAAGEAQAHARYVVSGDLDWQAWKVEAAAKKRLLSLSCSTTSRRQVAGLVIRSTRSR